jgi:hypothetical protein
VNRHDFADFDLLRRQRMHDAVADEGSQAVLIQMLELAPAAKREMLAGWLGMVRAVNQTA